MAQTKRIEKNASIVTSNTLVLHEKTPPGISWCKNINDSIMINDIQDDDLNVAHSQAI